uniref:Elongator acetyltransferase complex subunit 6 n=1 Tax=Strix occidentalis caurina TaxID=311401 RepID=A0A8D0FT67_STROC
ILTAAKERGQLIFLEGLKSCLDLLFGEEEQSGQPSPLQFLRRISTPILIAKHVTGLEKIYFSTQQVCVKFLFGPNSFIPLIILSFILIQENSAALTTLAFIFIPTSLSPCP